MPREGRVGSTPTSPTRPAASPRGCPGRAGAWHHARSACQAYRAAVRRFDAPARASTADLVAAPCLVCMGTAPGRLVRPTRRPRSCAASLVRTRGDASPWGPTLRDPRSRRPAGPRPWPWSVDRRARTRAPDAIRARLSAPASRRPPTLYSARDARHLHPRPQELRPPRDRGPRRPAGPRRARRRRPPVAPHAGRRASVPARRRARSSSASSAPAPSSTRPSTTSSRTRTARRWSRRGSSR